ncbi:hypothetical protein FQR65_LT01802 [Abscondita terminalis]|nr:hypothetical protein FQR65_LT01802 [Abscondita terminalis]
MTLFKGLPDRFNGVTVNSNNENCDLSEFPRALEESLKAWKIDKKRGIWFKVGIQHSEWIPILVKNGFIFHHAKNDFVMLRKWLSDETDLTPHYAHTLIGVGAVVIKSDEVLVVKEKYGFNDNWKLPGGYVEPGENIVDAAIREVYEETNIETEFNSILNLRHAHGGSWGCSDMYVVVCLNPLTVDIVKCDREIKESKWMKLDEYLQNPLVHELNKFFLQTYLANKDNSIAIECKHSIHPLLKKPYTVYSAKIKNKI